MTLSREFPLAPDRHWGSLQVRYTGQPHDLGVQLEVVDGTGRAALDVRSWETEDFSSSRLLGLAGAGTAPTSNLLLMNKTSQPRDYRLMLQGAAGRSRPQAGRLRPHQSLRLSLEPYLAPGDQNDVLGIRVDSEGRPGDLVAGVLWQDIEGNRGFTGLEDPARRRPSHLAAASLFGLTRAERPGGDAVRPLLLLDNRRDESLAVHLALRAGGREAGGRGGEKDRVGWS